MTGMYSVKSAVPTGSSIYSFPIARGFTRLSTVYFTFAAATDKFVNVFRSPMAGRVNTYDNDDFEVYPYVVSARYPPSVSYTNLTPTNMYPVSATCVTV